MKSKKLGAISLKAIMQMVYSEIYSTDSTEKLITFRTVHT
jgi:hypothetical protein